MKHWTQYLDEGRRMFGDEVYKLRTMELKIAALELEYKKAQSERDIFEYDIYQKSTEHYSIDEITAAMDECEFEKYYHEVCIILEHSGKTSKPEREEIKYYFERKFEINKAVALVKNKLK